LTFASKASFEENWHSSTEVHNVESLMANTTEDHEKEEKNIYAFLLQCQDFVNIRALFPRMINIRALLFPRTAL
jgi:hypothetical protein